MKTSNLAASGSYDDDDDDDGDDDVKLRKSNMKLLTASWKRM